jgi:Skp family chaperone for outer membrane proteins
VTIGSRALGLRLAAAIAAALLSACAHASPPPGGSNVIGYIDMQQLVQKHPLYDQLEKYDLSIEAFDLRSTVPQAAASDADLRKREAELEHELHAAADRTQQLLDQKQQQYQQQEQTAIAAALRGAGFGGPTAAQIAGSVTQTAQAQQVGAAAQMQRDYASYRITLQSQDRAQIVAAQKALSAKAAREYGAQAEQLQSKESALSLQLANTDAPTRLALRTKLSSLALDDAAREDAQKQLADLDKKEADQVAAMRNRDQQTLAALQTQLRGQIQQELNTQASSISQRSLTSLAQRQHQLARQIAPFSGPSVGKGDVSGGGLPAPLRARIAQLHSDYQQRFQTDAKTTIADFQKTRQDLSRRYAALHGVDADAASGAQAQIATLRRKRDDLYDQITGQIDREVKLIAQQRGISVVLSDVVAPAGGVDLTPDALKDIESLHQ